MSQRKNLYARLSAVNLARMVADRDGDGLRYVVSDLRVALELEQSPSRRQEFFLDRLNLIGECLDKYFEDRGDERPDIELV